MAATSLGRVIQRLRCAAARHEGGLTDGDLLDRFLAQHDESAFAELVRRHGPMVLGVCRRVLRNPYDADDAFQATFLVLVRRAASVQPPGKVGNWLYGVAYRTALELRRAAVRRRAKEALAIPSTEETDDVWADLRPLLDQELSRLPDRYRGPVVLCDLEGQTQKEAARRLGCPEGTVSSRLARGRALLARRLKRHGAALAGVGITAALARSAAAAEVPAALAGCVIKAATQVVAGQAAAGVVSAQVAALTEGVLKAMKMTQVKTALALLLAVALVVGGAGVLTYRSLAAAQDPVVRGEAAAETERATAENGGGADARDKDGGISVKSLPPVVVRTEPQSGDTKVDATKVTEIRVTFSKEMTDQSWSWSQISEDTFPKTTGKPSYDKERRTCTLPVKLEAGKTYVIWVNSEKFTGFKDASGQSAIPYLQAFETKP
jgi:RNA polymerase sigma-70 factor (ECF subfamily)